MTLPEVRQASHGQEGPCSSLAGPIGRGREALNIYSGVEDADALRRDRQIQYRRSCEPTAGYHQAGFGQQEAQEPLPALPADLLAIGEDDVRDG